MKTKRLSSGLIISILAVSASSLVPAANFTSAGSGDWGVPGSWTPAGTPNTYGADNVTISATHAISYDGSIPSLGGNLAVANGKSITVNGGALTQTWAGPSAFPGFGTAIAIGLSHAVNGAGTLNINAGGMFISGTADTVAVGISNTALGGSNGNGTVNVNEGTMQLSGAATGAGGNGLVVGINAGATGNVNVGDGAGAAGSSLLDLATNNVALTVGGTQGAGLGAGTGTVTVSSDGRLTSGSRAQSFGENGGTGTLNINGGELMGGTGALNFGSATGIGNLNVTAGSVTAGGDINIGRAGGTGNFTMSGGTVSAVGEFNMGRDLGSVSTGTLSGGTVTGGNVHIGRDGGAGTLSISGGTLVSSDFTRIGYLNGTGTLNISSGALNSTNYVTVGHDGGVGTVNQTGGTVTFSQWAAIGVGGGADTSRWDISGGNITSGAGFEVGADRKGTMNISGTANVSVGAFALGVRTNGNGVVNKTGGTLTTNNLGVAGAQAGGAFGTFNLSGGTTTIVGGGGQSYIGNNAGSVGTLNINGATLNNTSGQDHQIGFHGGTGNLNITGGGVMNHNWWINVARNEGVAGTVGNITVAGVGSALNVIGGNDAFTNIGEDGTGTMVISGGGSFTTQSELSIARNGGSIGSVEMRDAASTITLTGSDRHLFVGRGGNGTYTQSGGTLNLNGNRVQIAETPGSTGVVNITGGQITNSQWFHVGSGTGANGTLNVGFTNPLDSLTMGQLYVGNGGANGTVNVTSGRLNSNDTIQVGRYNGGVGTLTVSGAGNVVSAYNAGGDDFVRIGMENGKGTVNIANGGQFTTNNSWFTIGMNDGSEGVTNVTGAGSVLTTRGLIVGWFGKSTGTLNISDNAVVNNRDRELSIGRDLNGVIANSPTGIVNISSGGILNAGPETRIGHNTTGVVNVNGGTINMQGGGWAILGEGGAANGTLNMTAGNVNVTADRFVLGQNAGAVGTYNQSGGATEVGNEFNVGRGGATGTLNLSGGTFNVNGWTTIGRDGAGRGTINVSNGATFSHLQNNGGDLIVGWVGGSVGDVNITTGGKVINNWWIRTAIDPGSVGNIVVDGAGSLLQKAVGVGNVDARTNIGESGTGTLEIKNGARMEDNGSRFIVGRNEGGRGTMTVSNGSTFIHNPAVDVNDENWMMFVGGHNEDRNNAVGTLNIAGGSSFQTNSLDIGRNGGVGDMNVVDSVVNITGHFSAGRGFEDAPLRAAIGNVNIINSTIQFNNWFSVGHEGGTGTMTAINSTISGNGDFNIGIDRNDAPTPTVGTVTLIGGTVTVPNLPVGRNGGTGTLNMAGGAVMRAGETRVGVGTNGPAAANGTINITEGTLITNGWTEISGGAGTSGVVNVTGPSSRWERGTAPGGNRADVQVGYNGGTGAINVSNGGTVNNNWWFNLGRGAGSNGTMTIDGVGSSVNVINGGGDNNAQVNIGEDAIGTLQITNGGKFNHSRAFGIGATAAGGGEFWIGRNAGSVGVATVQGAGSEIYAKAREFRVGGGGTATLNINDGAVVNYFSTRENGVPADGNFGVGHFGTGDGTINMNNGTLNVGAWALFGAWDTAANKATINMVNSTINLLPYNYIDGGGGIGVGGHLFWGDSGTAVINQEGGLIRASAWSAIGRERGGNATYNLGASGGGGQFIIDAELYVGRQSHGTITMGPGTVLRSSQFINLGQEGSPTTPSSGIITNNGGLVQVASEFNLGRNGGNAVTGTYTQLDGQLIVNGEVFVGRDSAQGTLNLVGGTAQLNNNLAIGQGGGGSKGSVNITHATMNVNGWTTLGRDTGGAATQADLNIGEGGVFNHLNTGGDLLLGWQAGTTANVNVTGGGQMNYNWWVRLGVDGGSTGNLTIDGEGSKFEQGASDVRFFVGEGATGNLTVSNGGTLITGRGLIFGGTSDENKAGTGTGNIAGGHVFVAGETNLGWNPGASGTVNMTGGTMSNDSWFVIGRSGTGTFNQIGGRTWNTSQELRIGNDAPGVGTLTVSGGNFHSSSNGMVGEAGNGSLTVVGNGVVSIGCDNSNLFIGHLNGSKGTVNVEGGLLDVSEGIVEFNTQGGAVTSVLNLNSGILATRFISNATGNAIAQINANGGTLRASQDEGDFIRGFSSAQLNLTGAGLTIDSNSFTVSVNSVFSGTGGLTKRGFGQLNLTKNQVNAGDTGVTSGVLNLDFSTSAAPNNLVANSGLVLGGGTLRVTTSATLANTQNFTGTTINSGSSRVEVVENGGAGTVNLGAITRNAGGTVDVGSAGTVTTASTNVNGILGKGLTLNGNEWAKNDGTGKIVAASAGDYSATFGATNNLNVTAPIAGGGAVNSIKASADILLNANTTVASGGILIPSTAGNVTIASAAGETLTSGNGLDLIVIQNSAAGTAIIASKITGAGVALTKSGNGTLVLGNTANDYDGGTFINSGVLVIGADSALGNVNGGLTLAAPSLATGGILAVTNTMTLAATRSVTLNSGGGGFNVPATKTLTINQDISGAGGLAKVGDGVLVLGGMNTYTGATAVFGGSLVVNGTVGSTAGFIADGNLTLGSGSAINSTGTFEIARNAGPTVTVTGVDASLSGTEFTIGGNGNATVTLTGASSLAATCDMFVARANGSTSSLTVTGGEVIAERNLMIGAISGANGTVSVTDGRLIVGNGLLVGADGGNGTLNLAGTTQGAFGIMNIRTGTVNVTGSATLIGSNADSSGYINVGEGGGGPAVVNQSGGQVKFNSWMTIGIGGGSPDPANSKYVITGGTLSSPAGIEVGSDHGGTLDISGTGAVKVGSVSIGTYGDRGGGLAGNGVVKITGGTLTTNEINVGHNANNGGQTSVGVYTQSGGVTTINGSMFVTRNGGGGGSSGTVNLNGGELKLNSFVRGGGATAQLNFNGTVIKPNATTGNFISGFDASNTEILAGGAIFNTDGKNIRVDTSLDGVGAVTKTGNGILTVGGSSSYTGGVRLDQGTLSVRSNTGLGTGTLIANGGILSFDNSGGAGLIEGKVSTTDGFDRTSPIPADAVQLGTPKAHTTNTAEFTDNTTWGYRGTLVVPAGPDVTWTFGKQFDDNVFLKIDGIELINNTEWNVAKAVTTTLAAGDHTFELRLGQGGGGVGPNNGWPIGFGIDRLGRNTADPTFFTALTDPGDGSVLKYNDEGGIDYTVANAISVLVPTQVHVKQFGATLTGDIGGVGGINKTGNGRLTLTGTNSYSGGTTIAAGILEVGNGGATGSLGSGNVSNSGVLKFNRTGTLSVSGAISGAGSLEHNGTGTTELGGANTYTGATTINAGNLRVNGSISGSAITVNALGTLSGSGTTGVVTVNGGTVAPGASPGTLSTGNILFNGGTFSVDINGTTAGTLYDQLNVTGTVTLQSNVALALNFGYVAANGDSFTIINNDGTDAILGIGRFTWGGTPLQDGDIFNDFGNGTSLTIDYTAGSDNNDVLLAVVPEPGSLVMLMGGLAILTGARRRRRA